MVCISLECSRIVMNDRTALQKIGGREPVSKSCRSAGWQHMGWPSDIIAQSDRGKVAQKNGTGILNLRQHSLRHIHGNVQMLGCQQIGEFRCFVFVTRQYQSSVIFQRLSSQFASRKFTQLLLQGFLHRPNQRLMPCDKHS